MQQGGYYILDLKDTNLTSSAVKISGIYNLVDKNYRKVILLSGLKVNGVLWSDMFVSAVPGTNKYTIKLKETITDSVLVRISLQITNTDNCTLVTQSVVGSGVIPTGQAYFTVKEES